MNRLQLVPLIVSGVSSVVATVVAGMGFAEMHQFHELTASYASLREAEESLAYVCGNADGINATIERLTGGLTLSQPSKDCARIRAAAMARSA